MCLSFLGSCCIALSYCSALACHLNHLVMWSPWYEQLMSSNCIVRSLTSRTPNPWVFLSVSVCVGFFFFGGGCSHGAVLFPVSMGLLRLHLRWKSFWLPSIPRKIKWTVLWGVVNLWYCQVEYKLEKLPHKATFLAVQKAKMCAYSRCLFFLQL